MSREIKFVGFAADREFWKVYGVLYYREHRWDELVWANRYGIKARGEACEHLEDLRYFWLLKNLTWEKLCDCLK